MDLCHITDSGQSMPTGNDDGYFDPDESVHWYKAPDLPPSQSEQRKAAVRNLEFMYQPGMTLAEFRHALTLAVFDGYYIAAKNYRK